MDMGSSNKPSSIGVLWHKRVHMNRVDHLISLLAAHTPTDPKEAAFCIEMSRLTADRNDALSRHHFEPGHFTASAFVLSPDQKSVLLIFHGKLARWLQPGGHIDPDDIDVLHAAAREVAEETGLTNLQPIGTGLFDVDIHEIPARKNNPAHRHFDLRILLQATSLDFQAGSDALDAKWVRLEDVNEVESDASVMRAIRKLMALQ